FVLPTLIELDSFDEMQREIFGPVLHVVRYQRADLGKLLQQINDSGYGLTLGVHTRIDETIAQVVNTAKVGNLYVNRNMVGAVVGVQPFGGEGLSGTGPKAGGPLYMYRLLATRPQDAVAKQLQQENGEIQRPAEQAKVIQALQDWAAKHEPSLSALSAQYVELAQSGTVQMLNGPTGERNSYSLLPREHVLCLADERSDLLVQLAAALAVGCQVLWQEGELTRELFAALPKTVQQRITVLSQWRESDSTFDAILHHGDSDQLREVCQLAAQRPGAQRRDGYPAGTPADRTRPEHQHRSSGRQRQFDDYRLTGSTSIPPRSVRRPGWLATPAPPPGTLPRCLMLHCSARRTSGNGGLPTRYDAFLPLWHFDALRPPTRRARQRSYPLRCASPACRLFRSNPALLCAPAFTRLCVAGRCSSLSIALFGFACQLIAQCALDRNLQRVCR
ncbi:MAG: aldehyde dehydrogenase family protein, partial [Pseudomonadales bacterium]